MTVVFVVALFVTNHGPGLYLVGNTEGKEKLQEEGRLISTILFDFNHLPQWCGGRLGKCLFRMENHRVKN